MDAPQSPARRRFIFIAVLLGTLIVLGIAGLSLLPEPARTSIPTPHLPIETATPLAPTVVEVSYAFGRGYIGDGWQLYFSEPDSRADPTSYADGIDRPLAEAIFSLESSLDIAAFELNNPVISRAILEAHQRGVAVRIVSDDEFGLEDERDSHLRDLMAAGIPVVDDKRTGLMHNKFIIMDQLAVWTGSWNFTINGTYRNNNNALVLENAAAVASFQAEFDEMFLRNEFGTRSSDDGIMTVREADRSVSILFAAEADEIAALIAEIKQARQAIRFLAFVFSLEELADAILLQSTQSDFIAQGVFEKRNSTAPWSQLPALHCAGLQIRQDGNRYTMHHKVIIIDDHTVITGSFNFSKSAANNNDENIVIARDPLIVALYLEEWRRIWDSALEIPPGAVDCS